MVRLEWSLVTTAHNVLKLAAVRWRYRSWLSAPHVTRGLRIVNRCSPDRGAYPYGQQPVAASTFRQAGDRWRDGLLAPAGIRTSPPRPPAGNHVCPPC